jgi:hypothetical protein
VKAVLVPMRECFYRNYGGYPRLRRGARINCQLGLGFIRLPSYFGLSGRRCSARSLAIRRSQSDKAAQVLDGRHQRKLFRGAGQTAQLQTRETEVLLHMGEEHFDLLAQAS